MKLWFIEQFESIKVTVAEEIIDNKINLTFDAKQKNFLLIE